MLVIKTEALLGFVFEKIFDHFYFLSIEVQAVGHFFGKLETLGVNSVFEEFSFHDLFLQLVLKLHSVSVMEYKKIGEYLSSWYLTAMSNCFNNVHVKGMILFFLGFWQQKTKIAKIIDGFGAILSYYVIWRNYFIQQVVHFLKIFFLSRSQFGEYTCH